ncbi:MAG: DNA repair protein RadA [Candidatus Omnitrophica bacterium]|nr:DNA repair protein RadA [Candidatus Omnitrophota bacterium]MDD5653240.1 DNA repair protein RadA [Candidatus Omnitrophota bacterium]
MKTKTIFTCQNCGYQSPKWLGRCPDCNNWNSFAEEDFSEPLGKSKERNALYKDDPVLLKDIEVKEDSRLVTGIAELDRVLGGGIVPGSVVLIGGDPGIGKSTVSLQVSNQLSKQGHTVLYVSGEESVAQTKLRAKRLENSSAQSNLYIVNQTDLSFIIEYIKKIKPAVVIIDSIQVVFEPSIGSAAGSVSQVRECAGILTQLAKTTSTSVFIIGHVTKEGTLAGPRVLEHIVDTVLYFEGDRFALYRILRAVKNRFGSTNEIGVFEMSSSGLKEVKNPSEIFLSERPKDVSGSVVTCVLEGTRPLLVEIQSLVSKSAFGYATRKAQGFDFNRLNLLIAVLEKRIGMHLELEDIFVNVAGGIKIEDPTADLAVAVAIASAHQGKTVVADTIFLGELGLAGEVRSISQPNIRIKEAEKLGFKHCVIPKNNHRGLELKKSSIEIIAVSTLKEALEIALAPGLKG